MKIDGATLREWLERSAGVFLRIDPASSVAEQPLIDAAFASYNFDVIDGVTYAIDVTQPSRYDSEGEARRAETRAASAISPSRASRSTRSQAFIVVTNNYRASGGGNFPGCDGSTIVLEAPDANREALVRYIVETEACRTEGRRQLALRAVAGDRRRDIPDLARRGAASRRPRASS